MNSHAKYDQLISDLRRDLRPQRQWGEGRGLFLVIGHFVVGMAAGAWLFARIFDNPAGLAMAFVLAGIGGAAHLAFLGHPERFWRMATHARTSWISRGFWGLTLFLVGAFLYLVPIFLPGVLWSSGSVVAEIGDVLAFVGMLTLMVYMGFVYTASKGIPFWNSPLHPALYIAYALRGGIAMLLIAMAFGAPASISVAHLLLLWIAITAAVMLFFALELHGALTSGNSAARRSAQELLAGRVAAYFYGGTLALGVLLPAWFVWAGLSGPLSLFAMAVLGVTSAFGDFFMKYSTIRAGVHLPVWSPVAASR